MPTEQMQDDDAKDPSPSGVAKRLSVEFKMARKFSEQWQKTATRISEYFRDIRETGTMTDSRLGLFAANITTLRAMLYGKTPEADVGRKFADANDDVARVAGLMLQRTLNSDIEDPDDGFSAAVGMALTDRLLGGMGNARVRYEANIEDEDEPTSEEDAEEDGGMDEGAESEAPDEPGEEPAPLIENVRVDYCHWSDQLWSPARTFNEVRWWAFGSDLSKEQILKRFGKDFDDISFTGGEGTDSSNSKEDELGSEETPWARVRVWEVWDKENKKVYWYVDGYRRILDQKDDPLELKGFWPFPQPFIANTTNDAFLPYPDFKMAEDLYLEIDSLTQRIDMLQRAIRVVGVYDSGSAALADLLEKGGDNQMIPVSSWAVLAEKGGLKGVVDWFPLEMVVNALKELREVRQEDIQLLYQITGMSDILRGGSSAPGTTATEQKLKARFASVRVQSIQDSFAKFCSDLQQLKAEVIGRFFKAETIIERSNVMNTPDADLAMQAVKLIQSPRFAFRVTVKPDSVSLTDYAQLKQERGEFMGAFAQFVQSITPLVQMAPDAMPLMLEIGKWVMAGYKGADSVEGTLDRLIAQVQQAQQAKAAQPPPQPPPDPALQVAQVKMQGDMQKAQLDAQANIHQLQMTHASEAAKMQMEHASSISKIQTEHQAELARIQAETGSEIAKQAAQAKFNMEEEAHRARLAPDPAKKE